MNENNNNQQNNFEQNNSVNNPNIFKKLFKTESKIKWPLVLILSIIPMALLMILVNDNPNSASQATMGTMWGLSMLVFVLDIVIIALLRRFYKNQIKMDMYQITVATTWFFIAWYAIPIDWWNLIVSVLLFLVFYFVTTIVLIGVTIYKQKTIMDKAMAQMNENPDLAQEELQKIFKDIDPAIFEQFKNYQNKDLSSFNNQNQSPFSSSKSLNDLDQKLREEGIDVDKLDAEYGSFLDKDQKESTIEIEVDENNQEEIILPPTPEDIDTEEDDKKIIDQ